MVPVQYEYIKEELKNEFMKKRNSSVIDNTIGNQLLVYDCNDKIYLIHPVGNFNEFISFDIINKTKTELLPYRDIFDLNSKILNIQQFTNPENGFLCNTVSTVNHFIINSVFLI